MSEPPPPHGPLSRPRLALAMMLGVYPIITGLAYLIFPLTPDWPIHARTLVLVPLMVLSVVYVVTPAVHRVAGRWLRPPVAERVCGDPARSATVTAVAGRLPAAPPGGDPCTAGRTPSSRSPSAR